MKKPWPANGPAKKKTIAAPMSAALPLLDVLDDVLQQRPASCDACGACCRQNGSPPLLLNSGLGSGDRHPYRFAGMPAELISEIDDAFLGLHRGQEPDDVCVWYDQAARQCRHYEWRPQVCRDFEIASAACLTARRRAARQHAARNDAS